MDKEKAKDTVGCNDGQWEVVFNNLSPEDLQSLIRGLLPGTYDVYITKKGGSVESLESPITTWQKLPRKKRVCLSDSQKDAIQRESLAGATVEQLMERYKVSRTSVNRYIQYGSAPVPDSRNHT